MMQTSKWFFIFLATGGTMLSACERRPVDEVAAISAAREPAVPRNETSGASGDSSTSGASSAASSAAASADGKISDAAISGRIKSALLADPETRGGAIAVDTKTGEVTLSGSVKNQTQVEKAVKIASAVEGVKSVNNRLSANP